MTVICGGGASQKKALSPAVVFLSGESLTALATEILALPEAWIALLAFAAGQSIDLTTFCQGDPPAMPTFSALEIATIIAGNEFTDPATFAKIGQLAQIAAWYAFCECASAPQPAAPAGPSYPTGAPVINPPGPKLTAAPCWDASDRVGLPFNAGVGAFIYPPDPRPGFGASNFWKVQFPGNPVFEFTWQVLADGTTNAPAHITVTWVDVNNNVIRTDTETDLVAGSGAVTYRLVPPAAWNACSAIMLNNTTPANNNHGLVRARVFCDGTDTNTPVSPCCPPDPQLEAKLNKVLQLLGLIYQGLPVSPTSYAESTVHAGLTGGGRVTLGAGTIAVRVDVTTDNPSLPTLPGDPAYLWDRGYIVPIAAEGPIRGITRLVYNPQLYQLPPLTEQIGYETGPGVTIRIVELTRGP